MRYIIKGESPAVYEKWKKDNPGKNYKDLDPDVRRLVRASLIEEQAGLCGYCNGAIDVDSSHIDHVVQRRNAPALQHDYKNMIASCMCDDTCGIEKDRQNNPLKLLPYDPNCEELIGYLENGGIFGNNSDAKDSIEILKLSDAGLAARRKAAIDGYIYCNIDPSRFDDLDEETLLMLLDDLNAESAPLSPYHSALVNIVKFHLELF